MLKALKIGVVIIYALFLVMAVGAIFASVMVLGEIHAKNYPDGTEVMALACAINIAAYFPAALWTVIVFRREWPDFWAK